MMEQSTGFISTKYDHKLGQMLRIDSQFAGGLNSDSEVSEHHVPIWNRDNETKLESKKTISNGLAQENYKSYNSKTEYASRLSQGRITITNEPHYSGVVVAEDMEIPVNGTQKKLKSVTKQVFRIIKERCKNRITYTQFKRYVTYFKNNILKSNLIKMQKKNGQKEYNLHDFREAIFGHQREFYGEALWIFEQVFSKIKQGTEAYDDGDYHTNVVNLDDVISFLSILFPEIHHIAQSPLGQQISKDGSFLKFDSSRATSEEHAVGTNNRFRKTVAF